MTRENLISMSDTIDNNDDRANQAAVQQNQIIDYLLHKRGIGTEFIDSWGKPAVVKAKSQHKLLSAMGYDLNDEPELIAQLEDEVVRYWLQPLNTVYVNQLGDDILITLRTNISHAGLEHSFNFSFENGEKRVINFVPVDNHLVSVQEINDEEWHEYKIQVPNIDILGYHHLELLAGDNSLAKASFIMAPQACYIPDSIKKGGKVWGLSIQLYCLKSLRNWGVGDFTDLQNLVIEAAKRGADFIGLNPIHSLYPANPEACSPYGPSSRRWLNYMYLDVEKILGTDDNTLSTWIEHNHIDTELTRLRDLDYIDYEGVAKVKLAALEQVFTRYKNTVLTTDKVLKTDFDDFIAAGGESLQSLATYEALQSTLKQEGKAFEGWPVFPENLRSGDMPDVATFADKHQSLIEFYLFLQWQAALQFKAASAAAENAGMKIGLYRDLAVGVSAGSAETWGNQDLYCNDVSIGAPPDVLGPLGQKWGLPPMDPVELEAQAYQPIIDLFRANMQCSGALRIDHVMALLRLWWVHINDDAREGAYVNYPVDDLLAILALESERNQSMVIGEDLGTVPDSIREKLHRNGMYSYKVFFFEQAQDGGFFSPSHYPEQSMATLTTHDMPTLIGYWHCDDLSLGKSLGVYPDEEVLANLYNARHQQKQQILNTLHGHQSIDHNISTDAHQVGMTTELNWGLQAHMAAGSSALLSLQLEDWLQMDKPVNIPGTFNEYPNWKRKLSHNLEDIFAQPGIEELTMQLSLRRTHASHK